MYVRRGTWTFTGKEEQPELPSVPVFGPARKVRLVISSMRFVAELLSSSFISSRVKLETNFHAA